MLPVNSAQQTDHVFWNANIEESTNLEPAHLAEAIQYRSLDRESWAG